MGTLLTLDVSLEPIGPRAKFLHRNYRKCRIGREWRRSPASACSACGGSRHNLHEPEQVVQAVDSVSRRQPAEAASRPHERISLGRDPGYEPIAVQLPSFGVFVFESHHRPGFRMAFERHEFLELFYVLDGAGTFHFERHSCRCRRGELIAVPPGLSHWIEDNPSGPLALFGIAIDTSIWRCEPELVAHLPASRLAVGGPLAARVRADLKRLLFEQTHSRPGCQLVIVGLTLQLLALLARAVNSAEPMCPGAPRSTSYRKTVEQYVVDLAHRFLEDSDLDSVAQELGMSRRRFTQLFRQITANSWAAHIARLRVQYACRLLQESSRSILSTAFECGYDDLSLFYRVFRRHTGMTPRAWRKKAQQ